MSAPSITEAHPTETLAGGDHQPFSRKVIISLVLIALNVLAWNEKLDANAHLGAIVLLGIPALLLGFSALNDARHGTVKGRGWAIAATVLAVLMILASLGGLTDTQNPTPEPDPALEPVVTPPLPQPEQPAIARVCMTQYGTCPMMVALPVGSACTCSGEYGVFPGLAQ